MSVEQFKPTIVTIDCHVHLMPHQLMEAIRGALNNAAGWEFSHPTDQSRIESVLRNQGIERYCALPYAHKEGIADDLNEWLLARASKSEMCIPFATVHGDDDVNQVVRDAFEAGARGLKFQCPVQEVRPDDPRLDPAFELAAEYDRPILFHAGTAPMFEDSPYVGVDAFRSFCETYPDVRACSAHMGAFETDAFIALLEEHDNVYLDTCVTMSTTVSQHMDFNPEEVADEVFVEHSERIMYGSDYPNIPYPYEAERTGLLARDLPDFVYRNLFGQTAKRFLEGR